MTSALSTQVGGSHYKKSVIQPILLSYAVAGGDSCFTKAAKYLSREKENIDSEKAYHVCLLAKELRSYPIMESRDYTINTDLALIDAYAGQFANKEQIAAVLVNLYKGHYKEAAALCLK